MWNSKYSYGDNTLQGDTRYVQEGALFQQHKLELKSKYVTARGYYVNFNQGDKSFNTVLLAEGINNSYSIDDIWYQDYGAVYGNTFETAIQTNSVEQADIMAHEQARIYAERHKNGTIDAISNTLKNKNISDGGAKTTDNSSYINGDIDFNLTDVVTFADIQMGATYRQHKLNSKGQLFTDLNDPIIYDSYGIYTQVIKKLVDDRLRLTGSIRYDKSTNFKGNYSPRISATYASGVNRNHNFRGSYQTAFRNPTSADQYADQNLGSRIFEVGNVSGNLERYVSRTIALRPGSPGIPVVGTSVSLTGKQIVENSYTLNSQQSFSNAVIESIDNNISPLLAIQNNVGLLEKATINPLRTEKVKTFETGYRSSFDLFGSLFEIDVNGYYSIVEDFIVTKIVSTPLFGDINQGSTDLLAPFAIGRYDYAQFAFRVNSPQNHDYYGGGISLSTAVLDGLNIGVNYMYNKFKEHQKGGDIYETGSFFNTPEHKFRASLGKETVFKNVGFNINARWQDSFLWSSNAVNSVISARTVLDAQINLRVPTIKSTFKVGGTNLFGTPYLTAPGIGEIGSVYYVSWKIND
ncbi:TonB-dependent receptor domain-containing protein [Tenacibaculum pacificus]|uniref:TonB-dependent receptor domain-containing protein n=1 Tax=Tenacibaculum pacificus TaxID=3018314 RepID=UPI002FDDC71B